MSGQRVTFVCDSDAWGGAEVYLTHLLRRAPSRGWTASLVCAEPVAGGFGSVVDPAGVQAVPLARHGQQAPAVQAAVAASQPDVVVVNLVDPASNAAAVAAALEGAPTVGVLHLAGDTGAEGGRRRLAAPDGRVAAGPPPAAGGGRPPPGAGRGGGGGAPQMGGVVGREGRRPPPGGGGGGAAAGRPRPPRGARARRPKGGGGAGGPRRSGRPPGAMRGSARPAD